MSPSSTRCRDSTGAKETSFIGTRCASFSPSPERDDQLTQWCDDHLSEMKCQWCGGVQGQNTHKRGSRLFLRAQHSHFLSEMISSNNVTQEGPFARLRQQSVGLYVISTSRQSQEAYRQGTNKEYSEERKNMKTKHNQTNHIDRIGKTRASISQAQALCESFCQISPSHLLCV